MWQEYTEELHKEGLTDPDNHHGMVTHLEPDILECDVKHALGCITMNKVSRGDGIPAELFQILRDDAVKVLHLICQQIWKIQQWPQNWKRSVSLQSQRRVMPKIIQTTEKVYSLHMLNKVILKILQARLQLYVNQELPDIQVGFSKSRGTRDQIANIHWITGMIQGIPKRHLLLLH